MKKQIITMAIVLLTIGSSASAITVEERNTCAIIAASGAGAFCTLVSILKGIIKNSELEERHKISMFKIAVLGIIDGAFGAATAGAITYTIADLYRNRYPANDQTNTEDRNSFISFISDSGDAILNGIQSLMPTKRTTISIGF